MTRRSVLVNAAERALQERDRAERRAARSERAANRLPGLLHIHAPRVQAPAAPAGEPPTIWCCEDAQPWPCRTIQYAFQTGEFAEPVDDPPAATE